MSDEPLDDEPVQLRPRLIFDEVEARADDASQDDAALLEGQHDDTLEPLEPVAVVHDVDDADNADDDDVLYVTRYGANAVGDGDSATEAGDDVAQAPERSAERKPRLPPARVRQLLAIGSGAQAVASDAAHRAALSVEDFIADFAMEAAKLAQRRAAGASVVVTYAHLVEVAQTVERFCFLTDALLPERTLPKGQRTLAAAMQGKR
jgi:hypothetical protein